MSKDSTSKEQPLAQKEMMSTDRQKEEPLHVPNFSKEVQEYAKRYRENQSIKQILGHDQFMTKHLNHNIQKLKMHTDIPLTMFKKSNPNKLTKSVVIEKNEQRPDLALNLCRDKQQ